MKVRTASRSTGGVAITDISRTPVSASCSVRGMGVAVSVSTCTSSRRAFSRSLCADAEMLLLVDDDKPEILERDVLGEQRMRADHDIDLAVFQLLARLRRLLGGHEPRGARELHRKAVEAVGEGLVMLAREQRRRHDNRHLLALHHRDEGRAQRHLRLAEADVAADRAGPSACPWRGLR